MFTGMRYNVEEDIREAIRLDAQIVIERYHELIILHEYASNYPCIIVRMNHNSLRNENPEAIDIL